MKKDKKILKFRNILGKNVDLKPLALANSNDFYRWSNSEDFNKFLEYTPHKSIHESEEYLNLLKKDLIQLIVICGLYVINKTKL